MGMGEWAIPVHGDSLPGVHAYVYVVEDLLGGYGDIYGTR